MVTPPHDTPFSPYHADLHLEPIQTEIIVMNISCWFVCVSWLSFEQSNKNDVTLFIWFVNLTGSTVNEKQIIQSKGNQEQWLIRKVFFFKMQSFLIYIIILLMKMIVFVNAIYVFLKEMRLFLIKLQAVHIKHQVFLMTISRRLFDRKWFTSL